METKLKRAKGKGREREGKRKGKQQARQLLRIYYTGAGYQGTPDWLLRAPASVSSMRCRWASRTSRTSRKIARYGGPSFDAPQASIVPLAWSLTLLDTQYHTSYGPCRHSTVPTFAFLLPFSRRDGAHVAHCFAGFSSQRHMNWYHLLRLAKRWNSHVSRMYAART